MASGPFVAIRKVAQDLKNFAIAGPTLSLDMGGPVRRMRHIGVDPHSLGEKKAYELIFAKQVQVETIQGGCPVYDINRDFYEKFGEYSSRFNLLPSYSDKRHKLMDNPKTVDLSKIDEKSEFRRASEIAKRPGFTVSIEEFNGFDRFVGTRKFYSLIHTPKGRVPKGGFPFAMIIPGLGTVAHMYEPIAKLLANLGYKVMTVDRPPDMLLDIMVQGLSIAFYAAVHAGGMKDVAVKCQRNIIMGLSEGAARAPSIQAISRMQRELSLGPNLPFFPNGVFFSGPYYMREMYFNLEKLSSAEDTPQVLKSVMKMCRDLGIERKKTDSEFWWEIEPRLFVPMLRRDALGALWKDTRNLVIGGLDDPVVPFSQPLRLWADLNMLKVKTSELAAIPGPGIHPLPTAVKSMGLKNYLEKTLSGTMQMSALTLQFIEATRELK